MENKSVLHISGALNIFLTIFKYLRQTILVSFIYSKYFIDIKFKISYI